jgi:hypothetical protein
LLLIHQVKTLRELLQNSFKMTVNPNYNINCMSTARNCVSGCCQSGRTSCANVIGECTYRYTDFYTNSSYYWPSFYNSNCFSTARNCVSGCCTLSGTCATSLSACYYTYSDYYTNSTKYYYTSGTTTTIKATVNAGPIAGGVVGGVVFLILIIGLIIWWKKKQAAEALAMGTGTFNTTGDNGGTTIIMTNPTQPAYGMGQPAYNQPFQPAYNQPPPMYNQPGYMNPTPFGGPPQQPIIIQNY